MSDDSGSIKCPPDHVVAAGVRAYLDCDSRFQDAEAIVSIIYLTMRQAEGKGCGRDTLFGSQPEDDGYGDKKP